VNRPIHDLGLRERILRLEDSFACLIGTEDRVRLRHQPSRAGRREENNVAIKRGEDAGFRMSGELCGHGWVRGGDQGTKSDIAIKRRSHP
jgi:hypothetical protein